MWPAVRALVLAAQLAGAAFAFTPDERQKNAAENIAQVIAGAEKCDDWAFNEKMLAAISLATGLDINDPATFDYVQARVLFHADRIKDRTREDICAAMGRLYGPEGTNLPDLAVRARK